MKINERSLRRLQKQRHLYDIQRMILANPIFKNLADKDQKTLRNLIYKAELAEMYIRDRNIVRVNQSFDEIMDGIMDIIDDSFNDEESGNRKRMDDGDED